MTAEQIKELLSNMKFEDCKALGVEQVDTENKPYCQFKIAMDKQVFPYDSHILNYRVDKKSLVGSYKRGLVWYHDEHISNL